MHCNIIPCHYTTPTTFPFPLNRVSSPPSPPLFRIAFPPLTRVTLKTGATVREGYTSIHPALQTSLYDLLHIPETGSLPEIKQAYKQLARRYHPDVSPADRVKEYTERFIQVNEAYETLSDPTRRAVYDDHLLSITPYHNHNHMSSFSTKNIAYSYNNNNDNEATEEKSVWRNEWQRQVSSEMNKRSTNKSGRPNNSSGARMRRQR